MQGWIAGLLIANVAVAIASIGWVTYRFARDDGDE